MESWTLGLGGSDHEFSAALMLGNDIRVAIESERVTRRKHGECWWYQNPVQPAVDYCLNTAEISLSEVKHVVASDSLPIKVRHELRNCNLELYPHHLCHAASSYMLLPPGESSAILVYDGMGSLSNNYRDSQNRGNRETFSFYIADQNGIRQIAKTFGLGFLEDDDMPRGSTNSIGMLYELVTAELGFNIYDVGKTMGLAAYGTPEFLPLLERFVKLGTDPSECFACDMDNPTLRCEVSSALTSGNSIFKTKANMAASVQALLTRTLLHCVDLFPSKNYKHLCLAGGCALNTVANAKLASYIAPTPLVIPPFANDSGLAFGALWLSAFEKSKTIPAITFNDLPLMPSIARPGRLYSRSEHLSAANLFYPNLVFDPSIESPEQLAAELANGAIIALFNGRSEMGPRALGGRSILADPRHIFVRERINLEIKNREPFRPLAPMIHKSHYSDFWSFREICGFLLLVGQASGLAEPERQKSS